MRKIITTVLIISLLTSCAKGVPVDSCTAGTHIYGFWGGLWHGTIALVDFICMLFSDDVVVYAPNNNGAWYAFGFCIGVGAFSTGVSNIKK